MEQYTILLLHRCHSQQQIKGLQNNKPKSIRSSQTGSAMPPPKRCTTPSNATVRAFNIDFPRHGPARLDSRVLHGAVHPPVEIKNDVNATTSMERSTIPRPKHLLDDGGPNKAGGGGPCFFKLIKCLL